MGLLADSNLQGWQMDNNAYLSLFSIALPLPPLPMHVQDQNHPDLFIPTVRAASCPTNKNSEVRIVYPLSPALPKISS